jgi:putative hydrolase of the HAD superfamily
MTPFRAVFLDVGGTLLHLDRDFILSCLAERGIDRDRAAFTEADRAGRAVVYQMLNSPAPGTDSARFAAYARTMLEELGCNDEDLAVMRQRIYDRNREGLLWTFTEPGTQETLQYLKNEGYTVGIVSNSDGGVKTYLDNAGLLPWIDFVVDSGTVGVEKPDPRIFQIACEQAGVEPRDAVHVGDIYQLDVVGARSAGVAAVLLDAGMVSPHTDVERINEFSDLRAWLERRAAA